MSSEKELYIILHNVRSVFNVGSIFRTADAAGVQKIYLTGYTPAPVDRFGRGRKDFVKVSLGAEKSVAWEQKKDIHSLLREFFWKKISIVALEQSPQSIDYRKVRSKGPVAVIVGNEVGGIPKSVLARADIVAEIPMRGTMVRQAEHPRHTGTGKESLNVSVATGIFLFSLLGR
ncbi:MAG: TrmH family RNA methyltransferase [Patescibacteria group bacterium]